MTSMSSSFSPVPEQRTEGHPLKDSSLQEKNTEDLSSCSSQASSPSQSVHKENERHMPHPALGTSEKSGKAQEDVSMDVDPVDQAIADAVSASEEEEEKKEQACDKIKRAEKENAEEEAATEECYKEMQQQAESLKTEGNSFFKEGLFHQAVEKYTLAIELLSDHTMTKDSQQILQSLLSNRAFCHIKLENYGSAIVDAERVLQFNPLFSKAYYRRGCAYLCLSKYKKAQKDFERVISLSPSSPDKDAVTRLNECKKQIRLGAFAAAIETEKTLRASEAVLKEGLENIFKGGVEDSYDGPEYKPSLHLGVLKKKKNLVGKKDENESKEEEEEEAAAFKKGEEGRSGVTNEETGDELLKKKEKEGLEFLKALKEYLKDTTKRFHKKYAYMLVLDIIALLKQLETLEYIHLNDDEKITICGDVHGQYYDLCHIFDLNGMPSRENPYLFNGDFVDRGSFSVECILLLFAAKLVFPNHFHLTRGNHETFEMNKLYGFRGEMIHKYDERLYNLFCEAFRLLPLAFVLNNAVFVVHGGLLSRDSVSLDEINQIDRDREPPDGGLMTDLLWSDPSPFLGRSPSKRGIACQFGADVTEAFLKFNGLKYVIRSHEMKDEGYEVDHKGQLITVFSAPNYCDQMKNKGAFIRLDGKSLTPEFVQFAAVPHPPTRPMQYANPMLNFM